jgi:hypothetical protein
MPNMGNEPESAAGGRLPLAWAKSATVAQVVAIAAGILAMVSGIVIRRIVMLATVTGGTVSWFPWKDQWHSVTYAGAGVLVAIVALMLRGRARWLHYPQIGLWLLVLADSSGAVDQQVPQADSDRLCITARTTQHARPLCWGAEK